MKTDDTPDAATRIDAMQLFAESSHEGWCCDCCNGYCPMTEGGDHKPYIDILAEFTIDGIDYIGTRLSIVRRDLVDNLPEKPEPFRPTIDLYWATIPDAKPPITSKWPTAQLLARILDVGLTLHEGTEAMRTGEKQPALHLYLGDQHVGWTMPATKGAVTPDELAMVRRIADAIGVSIDRATVAMHIAQGREVTE